MEYSIFYLNVKWWPRWNPRTSFLRAIREQLNRTG
jgi:hypothetical protein